MKGGRTTRRTGAVPLLCLVIGLFPVRTGAQPCLPCPPPHTSHAFAPTPGEAPLAPPPGMPAMPAEVGRPGGPSDPPVPVVTVRVRVPALAAAGRELPYRLVVENVSRAAAHHVVVRFKLPGADRVAFVRAVPETATPAPALSWQLGTLPAAGRKEIEVVVRPTGGGDVSCCARVQFEHGECVVTRLAHPALALHKTAPAQAVLHAPIPFRIEVTNTGQAPAEDVVVTDTLPDGLEFLPGKSSSGADSAPTWKLGTLAPGQTRRIDYQAASLRTGTFTNKAVVVAGGGIRQESSATVRVGTPQLSVVKTGPSRRLVNRPAAYRITVRNTGDLPATNVQVADDLFHDEQLRAGIELVRASGGGRSAEKEVRWSLGTLAPGASRTVEVVVRARRPGRFTNVVTASADPDVSARAQAPPTQFEEPAGLSAEIDRSLDPVPVGGEATCTVRVLNPGKTPASSVALTVMVPDGLRVVDAQGPTLAERAGQTVKFGPVTALAPGGESTYRIRFRAEKPGAGKVRAEITSGQTGAASPLVWEEPLTVSPAEDAGPPPTPAPGIPGGPAAQPGRFYRSALPR